jgi:carbonic anhydrase/acetyltransferase-like protein (isoleucine patch superfamily)
VLIVGSPVKVLRELTPAQIEGLKASARHYMNNSRLYATELKKIG